ncbi:MAG: hypothetical protein WAL56_19135 [Candidatus Sulfotelmatobacter sp.]
MSRFLGIRTCFETTSSGAPRPSIGSLFKPQHGTITGNPNTLPPQTYNQVLELGRVGVCAQGRTEH